jgi:hypothetical protein
MILIIEGPRGSGKSHLVDNFFKHNTNHDFVYYKWGFAEWSKHLKLEPDGKEIHYFSLGNILTILEMTSSIFKDKVLVLDRSIFSTYAWAMLRKRMLQHHLVNELGDILNSSLYVNCHVIRVNRVDKSMVMVREKKDMFDKYENYSNESKCYDEIVSIFSPEINNALRENSYAVFNNKFDMLSQVEFNKLLYSYVDK